MTQLDADYCGAWLNGTLFFRISGNNIGEPQEDNSLRDAYYILDSIVYRKQSRINKTIFQMDYKNIFKIIDESIFPSDFSIRVNVQSMLRCRVYSVSDGEKTTVVYQKEYGSEIMGVTFCDDLVEHSLTEVLGYLENTHKIEVDKENT
ncbi:immunity 42 family protein [Acetobacter fabarum]|nr:immunity 42 family protein [Acetobacter fabarum]MCP1234104.1 immunity 42 family protein [Acetobacter fabarum]